MFDEALIDMFVLHYYQSVDVKTNIDDLSVAEPCQTKCLSIKSSCWQRLVQPWLGKWLNNSESEAVAEATEATGVL